MDIFLTIATYYVYGGLFTMFLFTATLFVKLGILPWDLPRMFLNMLLKPVATLTILKTTFWIMVSWPIAIFIIFKKKENTEK